MIKSLLMSKGKSKLKNLSDYRLTEKKIQDDEIQVFFLSVLEKLFGACLLPWYYLSCCLSALGEFETFFGNRNLPRIIRRK